MGDGNRIRIATKLFKIPRIMPKLEFYKCSSNWLKSAQKQGNI